MHDSVTAEIASRNSEARSSPMVSWPRADGQHDLVMLEWSVFVDGGGSRLKPTDERPARFMVEDFPGEEEWQQLVLEGEFIQGEAWRRGLRSRRQALQLHNSQPMNGSRDDLLRPTLSEEARPAAAPYSTQATFFTGFFGGPFAALAIVLLNSVRLRRLGRDLPVLLVSLVVVLTAGWLLHGSSATGRFGARDQLGMDTSTVRIVYRLPGLLLVGVGYLLHRREQRNTDLLGLTRPNGWIAGVPCVLVGGVLLAVFIALLLRN